MPKQRTTEEMREYQRKRRAEAKKRQESDPGPVPPIVSVAAMRLIDALDPEGSLNPPEPGDTEPDEAPRPISPAELEPAMPKPRPRAIVLAGHTVTDAKLDLEDRLMRQRVEKEARKPVEGSRSNYLTGSFEREIQAMTQQQHDAILSKAFPAKRRE